MTCLNTSNTDRKFSQGTWISFISTISEWLDYGISKTYTILQTDKLNNLTSSFYTNYNTMRILKPDDKTTAIYKYTVVISIQYVKCIRRTMLLVEKMTF